MILVVEVEVLLDRMIDVIGTIDVVDVVFCWIPLIFYIA